MAGKDLSEDPGKNQGQEEVDSAGDQVGFKGLEGGPGHALGDEKELGHGNDVENRSVLDVDNELIADGGQDGLDGLGKDDRKEGLAVAEAQGLARLPLALGNGVDSPSYGLGQVGSRVDGDDEDGGKARIHINIKEHLGPIEDQHGLDHHGGPPENLHIEGEEGPDQADQDPVGPGIPARSGQGPEGLDEKADQEAEKGGKAGDQKGDPRPAEEGAGVI